MDLFALLVDGLALRLGGEVGQAAEVQQIMLLDLVRRLTDQQIATANQFVHLVEA